MADINALYQQILGRTADSEGAAYWQDQLNNGLSEADLVKSLYGSDEYKNDVNAVYQQNFGRDADTVPEPAKRVAQAVVDAGEAYAARKADEVIASLQAQLNE